MRIYPDKCLSGKLNGAIAIRALKRFVADRDTGKWKQFFKRLPSTGKKIAIVGSGPAGLTAGYYLARLGHSVTIFEALSKPGGMMQFGIPHYRLPKDLLDAEIQDIQDIGVGIKLNTRISSIDSLFGEGYDAIFLALGAHRGIKIDIKGADNAGVFDGAAFLRDVNSGVTTNVGDKVGVIGGGNTAIDSARTALRLGAKHVEIIYRRSRAEMPVYDAEIEALIEEGIEITFQVFPVEIRNHNDSLELICNRVRLDNIDASGCRQPVSIEGSEFCQTFNTIIVAIGQTPYIPSKFNLETNDDGTLKVDWDTLVTSRQSVWAGGDVVTGSTSVISAIACGRKAADSIDKYLGGGGIINKQSTEARQIILPEKKKLSDRPRILARRLAPDQRIGNFDEIELGLDEISAVKESSRCLHCGNDISARCSYACPAQIDVPLYVYLIASGRYEDALAVIREKVPFPGVLGRICPGPCEQACAECALCMPYCPVSAIHKNQYNGEIYVEEDECVECGCCQRANICPNDALWQPRLSWPRIVRAQFSDPCMFHHATMVSGRGTEESKTNDVTGRYPHDYVCIAAELGRPGIGTKMREVEKVARAVLALGVEFENENPTYKLFENPEHGYLRKDVLEERVLSAILEFKVAVADAPEVLKVLYRAASEVDTVVSIDIGSMLETDGCLPAENIAEKAGFKIRPNGKSNLGLGRPSANILEE